MDIDFQTHTPLSDPAKRRVPLGRCRAHPGTWSLAPARVPGWRTQESRSYENSFLGFPTAWSPSSRAQCLLYL